MHNATYAVCVVLEPKARTHFEIETARTFSFVSDTKNTRETRDRRCPETGLKYFVTKVFRIIVNI